jgi:NADPH2:quinone reductase
VIATAGTREKADDVLGLGADHVIVYTEEDFVPAVKEFTAGKGVDVVYDSVGKTTFAGGLDCLRPRGLMVLWGQASGAVPLFDLQTLNAKGSLYITRPSMGAYIRTREELLWRANDLFDWVQSGELTVRIDRTFALADAAEAHTVCGGAEYAGEGVARAVEKRRLPIKVHERDLERHFSSLSRNADGSASSKYPPDALSSSTCVTSIQ